MRGTGGIPARIRKTLLSMPDADGSWVAIAPRRGLKRARIIGIGRLRGEVEHLATESGFPRSGYFLFQVTRTWKAPAWGVDQAAEIRKLKHWAKWGCP